MALVGSTESSLSQNGKQEVVRKSVDFHPSVWGDYFITSSSDDLIKPNERNIERVEELKKEVKSMLHVVASEPLQEMNLIDTIQRLGVAYHFEEEIQEALQRVHDVQTDHNEDDADLCVVSLRFRLLRQAGYNVSPDAFSKFRDDSGNFKAKLTSDVQGMLSLYQAAHLSIQGEEILDEALAFTTEHLKTMMTHLSSPLGTEVEHALEIPLHKRIPRIEQKRYISIYQEEEARNELLLELAKLDFNLVQLLHKREVRDLSRWWKDLDFKSKLPFARDRLVECYFWSNGFYFEPQHSLGRIELAKIIAMVSIMDDIYDVYGTFEELQLFTDAIQRWDMEVMDQLPEYMKVYFLELLNVFNEIEEKTTKDGKPYLIHYLKEAMKDLVRAYFVEYKWFNEGYVPMVKEYLQISSITSVSFVFVVVTFVSMGEMVTKEVLEWVAGGPKILLSVCVIGRLLDDIMSNEFEQKRGHVASSVQCYMKEHRVPKQEACKKLHEMVEAAWKDVNQDCLNPTSVPLPLLMPIVNLARLCEGIYQYEDGYSESRGWTKEQIADLLVNPIPV